MKNKHEIEIKHEIQHYERMMKSSSNLYTKSLLGEAIRNLKWVLE